MAGQLGAAYVIPIIYVPLLMITHVVAFYWLARPQPKALGPRRLCGRDELVRPSVSRENRMTDTTTKVREHYSAASLTERIQVGARDDRA